MAKKRNPPTDIVSAINKANRDEDIALHGKPTAFRPHKEKSPKAYDRNKIKHIKDDD